MYERDKLVIIFTIYQLIKAKAYIKQIIKSVIIIIKLLLSKNPFLISYNRMYWLLFTYTIIKVLLLYTSQKQ